MAGAWSVNTDTKQVQAVMDSIQAGMADRTRLHERFVIVGQAMTFKQWPTKPTQSKLTLRARQRGGSEVLIDRGMLRLSMTGRSPATKLSTEEGTLNTADKQQGILGSNLIYAATHNYGATILPRRAKVLAVPMTPEATKAGSPRNFPYPLDFIPTKKKDQSIGLLVESVKRTRRVRGSALSRKDASGRAVKRVRVAGRRVAHYLLMKWVTIPQRRFLPTEDELKPDLQKAGEDYMKKISNPKAATRGGG